MRFRRNTAFQLRIGTYLAISVRPATCELESRVKKARSFGLSIAFVAVTLFAIAGVAFIVASDSQVAGSVVARPIGWLVPAVAASVVLGVSGVLLAQRRSGDEGNTSYDRVRCPACEREVMGQWRMCPYCGAMLETTSA